MGGNVLDPFTLLHSRRLIRIPMSSSQPNPALYFDHSATTPPRPEVIEAMHEAMISAWGNPSSLHQWGQRAAMAMEIARQQVADLIGAEADQIIFTSGGTEANNLALLGLAQQYPQPQHLIISSVEHSSVKHVARQLEQTGWQITRLPVNAEGVVNPSDLRAAVQPNTVLVSVLQGQNEVGALQPIQILADQSHAAGIRFHSDCVQTVGRLPISVTALGVDLLSLSGHKLYGPQGVGALYLRSGVKLNPIVQGGGQERQLRSGTQALPAIVGLGVAAALAQRELALETQRLRALQRRMIQSLADLPHLSLTGPQDLEQRLPHHLSYCMAGITGTSIVQQMDRAGIGISAGSACHRGQLTPSSVLLAMGYSAEHALGSIRISFGKATTSEAIDYAATTLRQILTPLASSVS